MPTANYASQMDLAGCIRMSIDSILLVTDRGELRRLLAESEQAQRDKIAAGQKKEQLEAELAEAEERHQRAAQAVQRKLVSSLTAEQREKLRKRLRELNETLQENCDRINRELEQTNEEYNSLWCLSERVQYLKKNLRATAKESLVIELEAAEIHQQTISNIARETGKQVERVQFSLDQAKGEAKSHNSVGWGSMDQMPVDAADVEKLERNLRLAKAVDGWANRCVNDVSSKIAELRAEIES